MNVVERPNHPYIPNSLPAIKMEMLREMGLSNIEELFADIPQEFRLRKSLNMPQKPISEFEVRKQVESLLSRNKTSKDMPNFLGAGCWSHYIPAAVGDIVSRSELYTSYTPYQPEISQGMLQALFEYQSLICELTDMGVSNCSMYDWASALGEAARMAVRVKGRRQILIPKIVHPERKETLKTYTESIGIEISEIDYQKDTGELNLEDLHKRLSDRTAAVYVENPSFLGFIESQVDQINEEAHSHGALFIAGVDPTSLGILKPPGKYDADIVVGEAQPLGNSPNYGGPLLGIMACRDDISLIRQMPGRMIGMTSSVDGTRNGFCMALQTREQHIRRERATSNICTNESLCAVASAVYLSLLGARGIRELGETLMYNTNYALKQLSQIHRIKSPIFSSPHFKEFTINFDGAGLTVRDVNSKLLQLKIHGGIDLSEMLPELGETSLYCITEMHSKAEIDNLTQALDEIFRW